MTAISKNIRYLRKRHNMTQDQLAVLLGKKNYTTIQKWESGISEPSLGCVEQMAKFFMVDIDDLVKVDIEIQDSKPEKSMTRRLKAYLQQITEEQIDLLKKLSYLNDDDRDSITHQINYLYEKEKRKRENVSVS